MGWQGRCSPMVRAGGAVRASMVNPRKAQRRTTHIARDRRARAILAARVTDSEVPTTERELENVPLYRKMELSKQGGE